mmetsp:Transcript_3858/g.4275  ORF Transcript_3858/g.4275 Transcript_3858/m.4275 type:complete len:455 (+) Transcript_3858:70-1434(+)|eukprot:CAMPEP_0168528662 /NCGR_PEP_ID=MMETSP0405-20121227/13389_1 /TAXON_ID=498012 /ORGANISM="Trichosphaerium sp, Strain Am-I-7 wt" /LENGTH=454 /DNA_ID=CAMNT_0008552123 /DNA_START=15 /DNA_END=1379 /DNA_ORIENTATION=-
MAVQGPLDTTADVNETDQVNYLQNILDTSPQTPERVSALQAFVDAHEKFMRFIPRYGIDIKETLVNHLMKIVYTLDETNDKELSLVFASLKTLSRETRKSDPIFTKTFYRHCMKWSGLDIANPKFVPIIMKEAAKCVVMIHMNGSEMDCMQFFMDMDGVTSVLNLFKDTSAYDDEVLFAHARLLCLVSFPKQEEVYQASVKKLQELGCLQIIGVYFEKLVKEFPAKRPKALFEVLRIVFNLTVSLGALAKGEKESYEKVVPNFESLIKSSLQVLYATEKHVEVLQYKEQVVNCFLNIPTKFITIILQPKGISQSEKTLGALMELLEITLERIPNECPIQLLMLLCCIAHNFVPAQRYFLEKMFPHRDLGVELELEVGKPAVETAQKDYPCMGNKLIPFLMSLKEADKYFANELMFQICGENDKVFIKLVGFGPAAGQLAMRNMFGMGKYLDGGN